MSRNAISNYKNRSARARAEKNEEKVFFVLRFFFFFFGSALTIFFLWSKNAEQTFANSRFSRFNFRVLVRPHSFRFESKIYTQGETKD
jgi:hypothetical protein